VAKAQEFDYTAKAAELEQVVSQLQAPEIQIDEATKLHAKGLKLASELEEYLKQAEITVKKHIANT